MIRETVSKNGQVHIAGLALCGVFAFLLAGAEFGGLQSPLQVALAGAVPPVYALAVLTGSMLSFFASGDISGAASVICALVATVCLRRMTEQSTPAQNALLVGGALLASSGLFFAIGAYDLESLVTNACLAFFAAAAAYFLSNVVTALQQGRQLTLQGGDGCALAVVYLLCIAALAAADVLIFNAGEIVGSFVILTVAQRYRLTGGAVCGILTAAGMLLLAPSLGYQAMLFGLGGMAVGYFADLHKGALCLLFLLLNAAGQLLVGFGTAAPAMLLNLAIGCLLFLLLPASRLLDVVLPADAADDGQSTLAAVRMDFLAQTLAGVRTDAERIARMLDKASEKETAVSTVSDAVCGKCRGKTTCWDDQYSETNQVFRQLSRQQTVTPEQVAAALPDCDHGEELAERFRACARQAAIGKTMVARLAETRQLLFAQMQMTEEILGAAGNRLRIRFSREQTRQVTGLLERGGFPVHTVMVYRTAAGKLTMELYAAADSGLEGSMVQQYLSDALACRLEYTETTDAGREMRICLWERPKYQVACFASQASASDDLPSGDLYASFSDGMGNCYLVLSDGMGSGRKASLDARIVLANFRRLVQSGVSWETAMQMVNSIMLTKSREESFATMDIVRIALETGEATMIKYGASSTLLKQGEVVKLYQAPTYPVGIIGKPVPYTKTVPLADGDVVIMTSDGVDATLYQFLKQKLLESDDLQSVAQAVCSKAQRGFSTENADDVTVLLARMTATDA